jgi:type I restriction enzyme S subunit
MINRIIKNFELIASAQTLKTQGRGIKAENRRLYGIEKLRGLILELAVMGKLVPQYSEDEPASKLLNRKSPFLSDKEILFGIPEKWEWCKLEEIGTTNIGLTYSPKDITQDGIPVLRSNNIQNGKISLSELIRVSAKVDGKVLVSKGDLLICARNGSVSLVGKCALIDDLIEKMAFGAFMAIFRSEYNKYIKCFIESPIYRKNLEGVNTTTINQITQSNLKNTLIPLPPLKEQHRIVAKVDELMTLCDQLEKEQTESNTAHETLVETLLDAFTSAASPVELETAWQRISDHFELLFSTEYSINRLKQTILQLAVMGKLVEQDPEDEPSSELLKRIKKEKERLVKEGKIKNQNHLSEIGEEEKPFEIPSKWNWCRLGKIVDIEMGQSPDGTSYNEEGIGVPLINGPVEFGAGPFDYTLRTKFTTSPTKMCNKGDLLICVRGATTGRTNIAGFDACIGRGVAALKPFFSREYLNYFILNSRNSILNLGTGTTFPSISKDDIQKICLPLPPSAEQKRIIMKVDELFVICDALKEQIRESQEIKRDFAENAVCCS